MSFLKPFSQFLPVVFIFSIVFFSSFLLFSSVRVESQNTNNESEFIFEQSINYPANTNLKTAWQDLENFDKGEIKNLQFWTSLETDNLSLPINFEGQNLIEATKNFNSTKKSLIENLAKTKHNSPKDKETASLVDLQSQIDSVIFTTNIDQNIISQLNQVETFDQIVIDQVTFESQKPLAQLSDFANKNNSKIEQIESKKPKVGFKNNGQTKTYQKTKKYIEYKAKIDKINQKLQQSSSSSVSSTNSSSQNSISSSSTTLPSTQEKIFNNISNNSNSSTSSSEQNIKIADEIMNLELPPALEDSIEKIDITDKNLVSSQFEKRNAKKSQNKLQITQIKKPNSKFIPQSEQIKKQKDIDNEMQKAMEYNKRVPQNYTENEKKSINKKSDLEKKSSSLLNSLFGGIQTEAKGLSNPSQTLLIYNRGNLNRSLDLPYWNMNNGNQFAIYGRHGDWNQRFGFNNDTNWINMNGKCMDVSAGNFSNGTSVQVWDCHYGDAQKWVFDGSEIKPKYTFDRGINLCLDANGGGLNEGDKISLWGCHGGLNQNWRAGDNDFSNSYQARIYAYPTQKISYFGFETPFPGRSIDSSTEAGHVFVAIWQQTQDPFQSRGGYSLKNTFGVWQNTDSNGNNSNRYNNIANNDAIIVDAGYDWNTAYNYGRDAEKNLQYRYKSSNISKTLSDYLRFGNGHRYGWRAYNRINVNVNYSLYPYSIFGYGLENCASYASQLWREQIIDNGGSGSYVTYSSWPDVVYNSI